MARPNLSYLKNLLLFVFGLPCGLFTGLTGMGTSVPLLPLLRFLLGLLGARASGTALAVTLFAALTGLLSFGLHGDIRWGLALLLTVGQFFGAVWGQRLAERLPSLTRLNVLWAVVVVGVGLAMAANATGVLRLVLPGSGTEGLALPGAAVWGVALLAAALVGLVSRVIGLGGVLLVPAEIYLLRLPPHAAEGTALLVLLLASLPGTLIHARRGDVEPRAGTWMAGGGVFGALVGAFYATHLIPARLLVLIFGVALALIGLSLLWRPESFPPADDGAAPTG